MTARNQTVTIELPDRDVEATLIVSGNPYFPQQRRYDVYLADGKPAGTVSQVQASSGFGRGRWVNRTVAPRMMWQPARPNGSLLPVQRTRAAALRHLMLAAGA